jgi:predicted HTH transcriptional regulator
MERYEKLKTCGDVFALAKHGIGESLTLDYKEKLSGKRRDLAADVSALSNTQGGVLVIGVKDPKPEGSPPKHPEDFVGVPAEEDLVHRVESQILDAISPRVFPAFRATKDTFERDGKEKCFLLVQVPASPELHQVTVERDFKHYRRAEFQNRAMSSEEIRRRVEEILAAQRGTSALFEEEISRLGGIMAGPYTVFLAAPTALAFFES